MGGRVGGLAQWQIVELGEHLDFMGVFQQCGVILCTINTRANIIPGAIPLKGGVNDPFV